MFNIRVCACVFAYYVSLTQSFWGNNMQRKLFQLTALVYINNNEVLNYYTNIILIQKMTIQFFTTLLL